MNNSLCASYSSPRSYLAKLVRFASGHVKFYITNLEVGRLFKYPRAELEERHQNFLLNEGQISILRLRVLKVVNDRVRITE